MHCVERYAVRCTVALAVALLSLTAGAADPPEVFKRARGSVLVLVLKDEKGQELGAHTAIAVGAQRAVTACDALAGAPELSIIAGETRLTASVKSRDTRRNLCLLNVPGLAAPAMARAELGSEPPPGERIFAISNALGLGISISEGVISGVRAFGTDRYLQFSAPISPGSEGGALVDAEGRLVGVIDYRHRDGQNVNFAAPVGWIVEIDARQLADDGLQKLRDRAAALGRESKWPDLLALSREWCAKYPEDIDAWGWLAVSSSKEADLETEERAWREVRRINPSMVSAGVGLARVMLKRGQSKESLELARSLLTSRQEDADVWTAVGHAELALRDLNRADEAYRRAISISPGLLGAHEGLIAVASQRDDRAVVTEGWSRLARLLPNVDLVQMRLIEAHLRENRPDRAFPLVQRLVASKPQNGDVWYWQARTLASLGRPVDARDAYRKSLKLSPSGPAEVWRALGDACFELKLFPESIQAYREAVKLAPDDFNAQFWLAVALKDGGYSSEALALVEKLAVKHPDSAGVWRQIGIGQMILGQPNAAATALERSLRLEPKQGRTWAALMEAYNAAGRKEDVKRAYETLRGIDSAWAERQYKSVILPYEDMK